MPDWRHRLLSELDAPASANNLTALLLWAASEGMPAASHNPLATSWRAPNSSIHPPYTMPWYPTAAEGVSYTARTLRQGSFGYPAILTALRGDRGLRAVYDAVNASAWCKGCQSGRYPIRLHDRLGVFAPGTPAPASPAPSSAPAAVPSKPWDYAPIVRQAAHVVGVHADRLGRAIAALRNTVSRRVHY